MLFTYFEKVLSFQPLKTHTIDQWNEVAKLIFVNCSLNIKQQRRLIGYYFLINLFMHAGLQSDMVEIDTTFAYYSTIFQ